MFLCNILNSSSGVYNNRSNTGTDRQAYVHSFKTSKYIGSSVRSGVNADLLL